MVAYLSLDSDSNLDIDEEQFITLAWQSEHNKAMIDEILLWCIMICLMSVLRTLTLTFAVHKLF